jgi:hypothetical protein
MQNLAELKGSNCYYNEYKSENLDSFPEEVLD